MRQFSVKIGPEVQEALVAGTPVVALETSIIAQGLPYPANLDTARQVEAEVRAQEAIPATIGIIDGVITVGLSAAQLKMFATTRGLMKLSSGDLPLALATGRSGATTVAATLLCSQLVGIDVIATGGIGGVHRGWSEALDISHDVVQLSQTSAIVVASGVKAILDISNTLELLETLGVSVITFGRKEFPAFWSRSSGLQSPQTANNPDSIADALQFRTELGLQGGILVANPIAAEDEIPREEIKPWIDASLNEARKQNIRGKDVTPFLLDRVRELSGGRAIRANRKLVVANAGLAARIASSVAAHYH